MMFTASIVTLVVLAEHSSIGYVFRTLTTDVSGWTNPPVAWGIGLLTVTYPLTGECLCTVLDSLSDRLLTYQL